MTDELHDGLAGARSSDAVDEHARAALDEAGGWLGDQVVAVGLGRTDGGDLCVVAHVSEPAPDLPAEVGGLPVRLVDSGPIQALREPATGDPA